MLRYIESVKIKDMNKHNSYFQTPNLPIIVWFVALIISKFTDGNIQSFFNVISFGAIFTWSWLEIFYGTNIFRRILGVVVITVAIFNRV